MSKYKVTWRPLTSEPEILNELMYNLGMERKTAFQDLVDIDTDLDDAIALIAIFAESEEDEKRKEAEEKRRKIPDPGLLGIKLLLPPPSSVSAESKTMAWGRLPGADIC